ncbi:MAG: ChbG/HpnK family deacetylase [Bacteroidota bacterium]
MKQVIINADDYGMTPAISEGIRKAYKEGILTSTTAMATGLDIKNALKEYKTSCPNLGLGVHLTVTSYDSVLSPSNVSSLIDENTGKFYKLADLINRAEEINYDQLHKEWKSQITFIGDICGEIDHLDSHHYACYINSKFTEVMIELSNEFSLPVRFPTGPGITTQDQVIETMQLLSSKGVKTTDFYFGEYTKSGGSAESLRSIYNRLENGTTEILTHCGLVDEELRSLSSLTDTREIELKNLCDPILVDLFTCDANIRLSKFSDI